MDIAALQAETRVAFRRATFSLSTASDRHCSIELSVCVRRTYICVYAGAYVYVCVCSSVSVRKRANGLSSLYTVCSPMSLCNICFVSLT